VLFLAVVTLGLRRHELLALRWAHIDLIDNVLRVERSKSEAGERSVAIPPRLAEELWQHRRRSSYQGDGERVFCHPTRGSMLDANRYAAAFRKALARAGVTDYVRPFHDARHASLTLGAANGESPIALMTRAGHANMSTTKTYLHLAGTVFRDEAERLEEKLLGQRDTAVLADAGR
jgi:integrase